MTAIGTFRVGEDIAIALDAVSGDVSDVTSITARMRRCVEVPGHTPAFTDDPAVPLVVSPRGDGAGWIFSLPASASAALRAGIYGVDARMIVGASVQMTETTAILYITKAAVD